ncbi:MAG: NAD-dependent epimerase/dehydratase family protein [Haloarculaceae archaeon]
MTDLIVTGGLGRSGTWVVDHLRSDYDVTVLDLDHPGWNAAGVEGVDFRAVDLTDFGGVADLVAEIDPDAVVHWGAIPAMGRNPGSEVFRNNVLASYNVLVSAGRAGADVVQASSESAYGTVFAAETWLPDYFPVDEAHELRPEDSYGASKVTAEELGKTVTRRYGVDVVSIRPSWIQFPGEYACLDNRDDLAAGEGNFWSYVDVRDIATLVAAGLETDVGGHEPFLGVAAENYMDRPTTDLIEEHFGTLPDRCDLEGDEAAFTTAKAREQLDWAPAHSYETAAEEDVPEPELVD